MKYLSSFAFVLIAAVSESAYASCAQNNNAITGLLGLDNVNGTVYADVTSSSKECGCSKFRFSPQTTDADKALSILMAAKVSDTKVRIDIKDDDNCDTAYRVYLH